MDGLVPEISYCFHVFRSCVILCFYDVLHEKKFFCLSFLTHDLCACIPQY